MKLYHCKWPDGSESLVWARSVESAIDILDEVGGATKRMLREVQDECFVDFYPIKGNIGPYWECAGQSESICDILSKPELALKKIRMNKKRIGCIA
jgi:hypothetical protein